MSPTRYHFRHMMLVGLAAAMSWVQTNPAQQAVGSGASAKPASPPAWAPPKLSPEALTAHLQAVPEVALDNHVVADQDATAAAARIKKQADNIARQIQKDPDAFVKALIAERVDLDGLPWHQGKECRLSRCQAQSLQRLAFVIRDALDASLPFAERGNFAAAASKVPHDEVARDPEAFWQIVIGSVRRVADPSVLVPALTQMVSSDNLAMRRSLVKYLSQRPDAAAATALVRYAVLDLHPFVREQAVEALRGRPAGEVVPHLVAAMPYPWAPAAQHAAEALAELQLSEAVPELVSQLAETDPGAPFLQKFGGKEVLMVRELVRVNHLLNCLLCHAPAVPGGGTLTGPVPTPGVALPPTVREYYGHLSAGQLSTTLVQGDVTYLRQDFALLLPVNNPGALPTYQRFDFLVRTRPMTYKERAALKQAPPPTEPSAHRQAVRHALWALTGLDRGTSAAAWKEALAVLRAQRRPDAQER
jgi:hypothetical protein